MMSYSKKYSEEYPFLDNSLVVLLNESDLNDKMLLREALLLNTMNIKFKDGDYDLFKSDIFKIGEKHNLKLTILENKKEVLSEIEKLDAQVKYSILRSIIFLVAGLCSLIGTIIYSIYEMRRELGIIVSLGASKKDLFIVSTVKIFLIGTIAFIISTILNYSGFINICGNGWYLVESTKTDFLIVLFAMIILTIISAIYPLLKVNKMDIARLVGGEK
ncbi:MAG: FtsX-like permease family protein [Clostridium sp.]|uniref:FtsX-like permease family protein n=1 Tax=Clostridium sp. TaxID=1506 RepID=UPI003EE61D81